MIDYPTMDSIIGVVISKRLATLIDLQTIYSLDDLYDLCEIALVNNYNESLLYEGK